MSTFTKNKNQDGQDMTEHAYHRTSIEDNDTETNDGRTMTTDERTRTDGQIETTTTMIVDEHAMLADAAERAAVDGGGVAEYATVDGGDPLACSPTAFATADEVTGGDSSAAPLSSAPATPLLPRKGYGSAAESSPSTSGRKGAGPGPYVSDTTGVGSTGGIASRLRKRANGGKAEDGMQKPACIDDAMSLTSANEDSSMASSSGVPRRKGTKRNRDGGKGKDKEKAGNLGSKEKVNSSGSKEKVEEEEQDGKKRKKKREGNGRETPEEVEQTGLGGEPKGVVGHVFEDMSSAVLGGALAEWVDQIEDMRKRSKNLHGKFSGTMKNLLAKIKEGAALLVVRSEAVGDPHFLRMRNTELTTRVKEVEKENGWLKEQARKASPGADSPIRKRKVERRASAAMNADAETTVVNLSAAREEFPPLPQRTPRIRVGEVVAQRAPSPDVQERTDAEDTEAESYLTQQINLLLAARNLERDRKKREGRTKTRTTGRDRNRIEERTRTEKGKEGNRKTGPRITSDVQLVPPTRALPTEGASTSAVSASETDWKVAAGGRRRGNRERRAMPPPLPPPTVRF